jgi:hypothetical protein
VRSLTATTCSVVVIGQLTLLLLANPLLAVNTDDGGPRERVIVMTSGRVLTGHMNRNPGGWLVTQSNGRIQVPEDQVKLVADSLNDAYLKQRDGIVEPTPATHVMLAQWCISYRLYDEASAELRKCLKRDPEHDEARKLLRRIEDTLQTPSKLATEAALAPKAFRGVVVPDVESLGGLSPSTAREFTQHVQTLLINKCGNSSCHGSNAHVGFQLQANRFKSNGHRMYTERNLAEILKFVTVDKPAASPLIKVPTGNHGGAKAIFYGPQGASQLQMLRTWVKIVSLEKQRETAELSERPSIDDGTVARSEPEKMPAAKAAPDQKPKPLGNSKLNGAPEKNSSSAVKQAVMRDDTTQEALSEDSPDDPLDSDTPLEEDLNDVFDPEIFNRRFHSVAKSRR